MSPPLAAFHLSLRPIRRGPCEHDAAMNRPLARNLLPALVVASLGCTNDSSGDATVPCNPVVGSECTAEGSACDNGLDGFDCYVKPNTVGLCGKCDDEKLSCANGLTCDLRGSRLCARWCCTDADCGDVVGSCDVSFTRGGGVGICLAPVGDSSSSTSTGGAGGAPPQQPVCEGIPDAPPSNGDCYKLP